MAIHKPTQGKLVRWTSFILLALFAVFTITSLGSFFEMYDIFRKPLVGGLTIAYVMSSILGILIAYVAARHTLLKPKSCDFLIDVETELRKVAWPIDVEAKNFMDKTQQLRTSSIVVFCVILFLAFALFVYDYVFNTIFEYCIKVLF